MAFFHLGEGGSTTPTFFETYAADKLVPSLKAAVTYSLSVRNCIAHHANPRLELFVTQAEKHPCFS